MELSGWGLYPRSRSKVLRPESARDSLSESDDEHLIARGQGRSYGDAALSANGLVLLTERWNRLLSFDNETGVLVAEAGTTIEEILRELVPRGWFPPVTPGTKFVSLGGAVAADIHGKNHHLDGTFGAHVDELEVMLADGSLKRCSPAKDSELFWATIGGMGLTGIITEVSFKLLPVESAYLVVQHEEARDLDASLALFEEKAAGDDQYSVLWMDCLARGRALGRGVLIRGHHARREELPKKIEQPLNFKARREFNLAFNFPAWVLNSYTVSAFNRLYYHAQSARRAPFLTDYESFFYPLDKIRNWNRMYGRRGFIQYQCVLPVTSSREGLKLLLEEVGQSRRASFLAVLKRFGREGAGLLSFPFEGYTLALDMPVTDAELFPFLDRLDRIVLNHGGRVYLAKDARMKAETFRAMYPRFPEWQRIKSMVDPDNHFRSDLGVRLGMCD
jgi:decaprenylphospho-beta-D-ribofuranose 2-oxidase